MSTFGKRLRLLRNEKKLKQEELGKKIGITQGAVGMYERGEREPSLEMIEKLRSFFGVTTDYLLGVSTERHLSVSQFEETARLYTLLQSITDDIERRDLERQILDYAEYLTNNKLKT